MAEMVYPADLKYTKEHEWIKVEGNVGIIGITAFAQDQLGDVVFVELPAVGTEVEAGKQFGTVESVKTVSDLFAPVTGKVVAINDALEGAPELVNQDPYGQAWMIKVELANPAELEQLLDAAGYQAFLKEEGH